MIEILNSIWVQFLFVLGVSGSLIKLTEKYDSVMSSEEKINIYNYLKTFISSSNDNHPAKNFSLIINKLFGEKIISIKSFSVSCIISIVGLTLLFSYARSFSFGDVNFLKLIFYFIFFGFFFNCFLDYISLIFSRLIIKSNVNLIFKILIDAFVSFLLPILWLSLTLEFLDPINHIDPYKFSYEGEYQRFVYNIYYITLCFINTYPHETYDYVNELIFNDYQRIVYPVILTSLTTSIWLWIHCLSELSIKILSSSKFILSKLDIKDHPVRAIGFVTSIIWTFLAGLCLLLWNSIRIIV